jgi:hypothetical protein
MPTAPDGELAPASVFRAMRQVTVLKREIHCLRGKLSEDTASDVTLLANNLASIDQLLVGLAGLLESLDDEE